MGHLLHILLNILKEQRKRPCIMLLDVDDPELLIFRHKLDQMVRIKFNLDDLCRFVFFFGCKLQRFHGVRHKILDHFLGESESTLSTSFFD